MRIHRLFGSRADCRIGCRIDRRIALAICALKQGLQAQSWAFWDMTDLASAKTLSNPETSRFLGIEPKEAYL